MAKYLDIFTDYGFKKIFGEEANKTFLIDFLNSLLPQSAQIKDLTFKNTEQLPVTVDERRAVYDIYCENDKGERFIVELQKSKQDFFIERTIYYSTFPIAGQAVKGEWDFNLKAVYCIGILDFRFTDYTNEVEKREVVHTHTLKNQNNKQVYNKLSYIYLEMPNFTKKEDELETRLDKWLYFIKNLENFQAIPEIFKHEVVFIEAIQKAELSKMTDKDLTLYYNSLKAYRDSINTLRTAKREAAEEGMAEGIAKGRVEGRAEGIQIGEANKEKFAEEKAREKQLEIARNCLEDGMSLPKIAKFTGLSEEEIQALKP